jgi:hypothetical protein
LTFHPLFMSAWNGRGVLTGSRRMSNQSTD